MKKILLCLLFTGCVAPNQATQDDIHNLREELRGIRSSIEKLQTQLTSTEIQSRSAIQQQSETQGLLPAIDPKSTNSKPTPKETTDKAVGTTNSGAEVYQGPRGGLYHYSPSGKKVYERKKK